jgi:hypothetical protein
MYNLTVAQPKHTGEISCERPANVPTPDEGKTGIVVDLDFLDGTGDVPSDPR